MKMNKKVIFVMIVLSLFVAGLMLAGNGNGKGNGGGGPADGTGNGPGDCQEIAQNLNANQAYSAEEIAEAFGLQVEQVYKLMNEGILEKIRSQNQLKVMGSEIQDKVNEIAKLLE